MKKKRPEGLKEEMEEIVKAMRAVYRGDNKEGIWRIERREK